MIEILWKKKVHYTRENAGDPIVLEVLELIEKQTRLYGLSLYSVRGLPNKQRLQETGLRAAGVINSAESP